VRHSDGYGRLEGLTTRINGLGMLFLLSWTGDVAASGSLTLTKSADPMSVSAVGQVINYAFVVTNNTTNALDVAVNDSQRPRLGN
jgi:hypothetical protein